MIQVQILIGDLHKGLLGSDDIIRGHQQAFAITIEKSYRHGHGLIVFVLSRHIALCNMIYLGQYVATHDLDLVKFSPDHSESPSTCFDIPWREDHDGAWIEPVARWLRKLFAKKKFLPKKVFWPFLPLADKLFMLPQSWLHVSERTAQELSNAFFPGLVCKIVSEIMSHFRKNPDFSLNLTFNDRNIELSEKWLNTFVMISDGLSNALFGFSLRCLGVELAGGFQTDPPPLQQCRGKSRQPEGCRLNNDG